MDRIFQCIFEVIIFGVTVMNQYQLIKWLKDAMYSVPQFTMSWDAYIFPYLPFKLNLG